MNLSQAASALGKKGGSRCIECHSRRLVDEDGICWPCLLSEFDFIMDRIIAHPKDRKLHRIRETASRLGYELRKNGHD